MYLRTSSARLSSLSYKSLLLLSLLHYAAEATHIEVFSDTNCQNQTHGWNGPNGYPYGRCTSLLREGNFTSFKIVNPDPGCAITIYGKDIGSESCSGNAIVATPSACYNTTWYDYSIDECFKPGASSSTTGTKTSSSTTTQTHVSTGSTSATAKPQTNGPNVGAIVGGVIGGVAFGVIVAAIGIISFIRYRRTKRAKQTDIDLQNRGGPAPPPYGGRPVEIAAKEASVHSAPTWTAHELSNERAVELQTHYVHELPSSDHPVREELGQKSPTGTEGSGEAILGKR